MTLPKVSKLLLIKPASLARASTAPDLRHKHQALLHMLQCTIWKSVQPCRALQECPSCNFLFVKEITLHVLNIRHGDRKHSMFGRRHENDEQVLSWLATMLAHV